MAQRHGRPRVVHLLPGVRNQLEREGIVHSQRTAGRFVTEDAERIRRLREELARQRVKDFLEGMCQLGFRRAEILALITQEADENAEGEEKTP